MRTFQLSDAKSHKFWSIDVQGNSFTINFGKIGTQGQSLTKTFSTLEKAQAEADRKIRNKTSKGYVETTPRTAISEAEALECAIRANPSDLAAVSAYADYLMEHDDPRGEFMQVQIALENNGRSREERNALKRREKMLLQKHEHEWLGYLPLDQLNSSTHLRYRFRRGWLAELEIPFLELELTQCLIRCKEARFLHTLRIQYDSDHAANLLLVRFPYFPSVRVFHIGNPVTEDFGEIGHCQANGELAHHFLKQMPNVEEIYLLAEGVDIAKIFALKMPSLRILQLFHSFNHPLEKLAANTSLTNLTHLLLKPHGTPYIRLREFRAICRSRNFPKLTHLAIRNSDLGDECVREILDSDLLRQLKLLDLRGGRITDEGAKLLAACEDFKRLERVSLEQNELTPEGIKMLEATGVAVSAIKQKSLSKTTC